MSRWPGILRAAQEMSYCNGGINRDRTVETMTRQFEEWMEARIMKGSFQAIDAWLAGLSDEELRTVVDGEAEEMAAFLRDRGAPECTNELLNDIFEEAI